MAALKAEIVALKLQLNDAKTERVVFDGTNPNAFQYLGFLVSQDDAGLRSASLARQWRKAKRSIRRTETAGVKAREAGTATKTFTKKLRRRFLPSGVRNFSSYARRSGEAFGSKRMVRQAMRLERMVEKAIKRMK